MDESGNIIDLDNKFFPEKTSYNIMQLLLRVAIPKKYIKLGLVPAKFLHLKAPVAYMLLPPTKTYLALPFFKEINIIYVLPYCFYMPATLLEVIYLDGEIQKAICGPKQLLCLPIYEERLCLPQPKLEEYSVIYILPKIFYMSPPLPPVFYMRAPKRKYTKRKIKKA